MPTLLSTFPGTVAHRLTMMSLLVHRNYPKSTVHIRVHSWCCPFTVFTAGLYKYIITCIHHYSVLQSSFITLVILCALPILSSSPRTTLISLLSLCPRIYIYINVLEIIQHVAFSDWLLSLRNMHLSFLYIFSWFDSSFHVNAE